MAAPVVVNRRLTTRSEPPLPGVCLHLSAPLGRRRSLPPPGDIDAAAAAIGVYLLTDQSPGGGGEGGGKPSCQLGSPSQQNK
ncbi:hypothetical protein EYF80_060639 [Liparis tanakae]|uniref:Uncharacterized protein n=1 Tax=Liparis tanakae TaxID=230148 RepID=A0A4Z2EK76_9TELE|nr:hypothetical protein EYF80_060639 [Liparis tanakae]